MKFILILVLLVGCTVDADIQHSNKHMLCTDIRDGETFSYRTNTAHNARMGWGSDSSVDIIDDNGTERTLTSSMTAYWKCTEIKE